MNDSGIIGSGVDLVENQRMKEMVEKWGDRFLSKIFLPGEREYCDSKFSAHEHYAARFAVKEAVAKAFGTDIGSQLGLADIETVNDSYGAPGVRLLGKGKELSQRKGVTRILVSLSHTRNYALAHVLLVGVGE